MSLKINPQPESFSHFHFKVAADVKNNDDKVTQICNLTGVKR